MDQGEGGRLECPPRARGQKHHPTHPEEEAAPLIESRGLKNPARTRSVERNLYRKEKGHHQCLFSRRGRQSGEEGSCIQQGRGKKKPLMSGDPRRQEKTSGAIATRAGGREEGSAPSSRKRKSSAISSTKEKKAALSRRGKRRAVSSVPWGRGEKSAACQGKMQKRFRKGKKGKKKRVESTLP